MKKAILIYLIAVIISGAGFYFIYPPRVVNTTADSKLTIKFNKPIKRQEISHIITPDVFGEWSFDDSLIENHLFRTLVFAPAVDFKPDTEYRIDLGNIVNTSGIGMEGNFSFSFETPPLSGVGLPLNEKLADSKITLIDIPVDWQDYPLSCEAASLKMAMHSKGVNVSEDQIMEKIGYDATPHMGNFWGDPDKGFVGSINGEICDTGYGVYWEPVAKAGNNWRNSEAFSNWTLEQLTKELELGNPVVFWGILPGRELTDCSWWNAKTGKRVKAFKQTHVRVAVGFIGEPENPSKIIINDPLSGRLYWNTQDFLDNWGIFKNSGVVVR